MSLNFLPFPPAVPTDAAWQEPPAHDRSFHANENISVRCRRTSATRMRIAISSCHLRFLVCVLSQDVHVQSSVSGVQLVSLTDRSRTTFMNTVVGRSPRRTFVQLCCRDYDTCCAGGARKITRISWQICSPYDGEVRDWSGWRERAELSVRTRVSAPALPAACFSNSGRRHPCLFPLPHFPHVVSLVLLYAVSFGLLATFGLLPLLDPVLLPTRRERDSGLRTGCVVPPHLRYQNPESVWHSRTCLQAKSLMHRFSNLARSSVGRLGVVNKTRFATVWNTELLRNVATYRGIATHSLSLFQLSGR